MLIGVPKEIKSEEYRVGLVPATIVELIKRGHRVEVETRGERRRHQDDEYVAAGAQIVGSAEQIFASAELIIKGEGTACAERRQLRRGQTIFHLFAPGARPGAG
jgi:alanine dehydrogenase